MDEATGSVDGCTELLVPQVMGCLAVGRTRFAIAHRLSTVRHADTILVMSDGSIAEQARTTNCSPTGGTYTALHRARSTPDRPRSATPRTT